MKKALSLLLALVICLSLCACGSTASIEEALQGKWVAESGDGGIYTFSNGRFACETLISGLNLGIKEGSYKVSNNAIKLSYDNGVKSELKFTYENGTLSIDGLLEQGCIDEALQGKWTEDKDYNTYTCYIFDNGRFSAETVAIGINLGIDEGSYEILGNVIILRFDDGTGWELNYTYENGTLTLDDLAKE